LAPKKAYAYYARGLAYKYKNEYDKAVTDFTESIRLDPKYANAYHSRGVAYDKMGENAKADEDFVQARKLGYDPGPRRRKPGSGFIDPRVTLLIVAVVICFLAFLVLRRRRLPQPNTEPSEANDL
jgi:tetratricopeptide (TPR) repeat protein